MSNPAITLTGRIGTEPESIGSSGLRFRIATSDSKLNPATNNWEDGPTSWWTVKAWKNVADQGKNVLRKGQEVTVVGTISEERWTDKVTNQERSSYEINARSIAVTTYTLNKDLAGASIVSKTKDDIWDFNDEEVPF